MFFYIIKTLDEKIQRAYNILDKTERSTLCLRKSYPTSPISRFFFRWH